MIGGNTRTTFCRYRTSTEIQNEYLHGWSRGNYGDGVTAARATVTNANQAITHDEWNDTV